MSVIDCPKCGEHLNIDVSSYLDDSRVIYALKPVDGAMLQARTIGESLAAVARLMTAHDKEMGSKSNVLVEKVTTCEDGTIKFHMLIAKHVMQKRT